MSYPTTGALLRTAYQDSETGERYAEIRANLNVLGTIKQRGEEIGGGALSYDVYTALLTQSGTSAPTATVLQNTLGGTVTLARIGVGHYTATLTGAFKSNKTAVFLTGNGISQFGTIVCFLLTNENTIELKTIDVTDSFAPVDGRMLNTSIEIRVYE